MVSVILDYFNRAAIHSSVNFSDKFWHNYLFHAKKKDVCNIMIDS